MAVKPTAALATARAVPLASRSEARKLVVAHHIVGLTGGGGSGDFTLDTWKNDIKLASSKGIDGFALNVGADDFTYTQVGLAYQAAEELNGDFQLFLSLDMAAIGGQMNCDSPDTAAWIRNLTTTFIDRPNQLKVDGKALVSTFAGESCTFGEQDVPTGWRVQFTEHPDIAGKIHFMPAFFVDIQQFRNFDGVMDGDFNFNGAWRTDFTTASASSLLGNNGSLDHPTPQQQSIIAQTLGSFQIDQWHIEQLAQVANSSHTYMTSVAPWFFTHFGPDTYNKNFIYDCDDHLYVRRWETLISNRDKVDIVQILTWNDFGESHYIGPIQGNLPPGSEAWTDGFDHQGFLDITSYFAKWFKSGKEPSVTQDQLLIWARPHPKRAQATDDPLPPPTNYELTQDQLWAVVLATAPGKLTLATADNATARFTINAGLNKVNMSLTPGGYMRGTLERHGRTVIDLKPSEFTFDPTPTKYNFNVFVAMAGAASW
ncbi:glycoside hydrolase family 71 protein [Trametes coccinea BRFM310]|uniref:Glycoside hydrolase family 71 protein n=1 Tax=Trametes coccinea (strain BRFM310) TaxID=1353009 RepID=A0A1Y2J1G3_TRAC3|nr:glycoside hydrolase family 71 protein [Trametes coccinea BRFM310]